MLFPTTGKVKNYDGDSLRELNRINGDLGIITGNLPLGAVATRLNIFASVNRLLESSVHQHNVERAKAEIFDGRDVQSSNKAKLTAVHLLASNGNLSGLRSLVELKADISVVDSQGRSPLDMTHDPDCQMELKKLGADGWTTLMLAAEAGDADTATQLLSTATQLLGTAVNAKAENRQHRTALHIAAEEGHFRVVQALVQAKADVHVVDIDGRTPLDLTRDDQCTQILTSAGAVPTPPSNFQPGTKVGPP
jgi:ankyrin repeat protein